MNIIQLLDNINFLSQNLFVRFLKDFNFFLMYLFDTSNIFDNLERYKSIILLMTKKNYY